MIYEATLDREYRSRILEVEAWCRFNIGDGGWLKDSDNLWDVSEAFGHHIFTFKNEADMELFWDVWGSMGWYTDMTNPYTARQVIEMIANDYVELSHDKIQWQRDDHMRICKEWLKAHPESSVGKYSDVVSDGGMDPR